MRRRAGVGAIQKQKLEQERYKDKGTELQERELDVLGKQLEAFRVKLEQFAANHRSEIKRNPTFRRQFQEMCSAIGVDPLASNKGFWSILNIGDFYYELSVQIVEVCLATSEKNGGLIGLDELRAKLLKSRGRAAQEVTTEDILVAAKKLGIFGNGFKDAGISPQHYDTLQSYANLKKFGDHSRKRAPFNSSGPRIALKTEQSGASPASYYVNWGRQNIVGTMRMMPVENEKDRLPKYETPGPADYSIHPLYRDSIVKAATTHNVSFNAKDMYRTKPIYGPPLPKKILKIFVKKKKPNTFTYEVTHPDFDRDAY